MTKYPIQPISRILASFVFFISNALIIVPPAHAANGPSPYFVDKSGVNELDTHRFTFGLGASGNQNYYDGDFADFDRDGTNDRMVIARWGLLQNQGAGYFVQAAAEGPGGNSQPNPTGFSYRDDGHVGTHGINGDDAAQWADLNNDGYPEALMGGSSSESFSVQLNTNGQFTKIMNIKPAEALNIINTDIENDGYVDIFSAASNSSTLNRHGNLPNMRRFNLWRNNWLNHVPNSTSNPVLIRVNDTELKNRGLTDAGGQPLRDRLIVGLVSGDVDNDGDYDLIVSAGVNPSFRGFHLYRNDGTGNYSRSKLPGDPAMASGFHQGMNLGDIDNDGDLDLVASTFDGTHPHMASSIYINNGNGNFTHESNNRWVFNSIPTLAEYPPSPSNPSQGQVQGGNSKLVDIDYDGDLDYVGFYYRGDPGSGPFTPPPPPYARRVHLFLNNGNGFFTFQQNILYDSNTGGALGQELDLTDMDGDGKLDLWIGAGGHDAHIYINQDNVGTHPDQPKNVQMISSTAQGNTIQWDIPSFASTARYFIVYRSQQSGLPLNQRSDIKYVGKRHQDEAFADPLSANRPYAWIKNPNGPGMIADPDVTFNGNRIQFIDRTATPGGLYYYSVVHVGIENDHSIPSSEVNTNGSPINSPPRIDWVNAPASADENTQIQITSQASDDEETLNDSHYQWTYISGPTVDFTPSNGRAQDIDVDIHGVSSPSEILTLELKVTDSGGAESPVHTVNIQVNQVQVTNTPPVAFAGNDFSVNEGATNVQLNGSGSDPDPGDTIVGYLWTQPNGQSISLSDDTAPNPTFNAPGNINGNLDLTFYLEATDNHGATSPTDDVVVRVNDLQTPNPPTCTLDPLAPALVNNVVNFDVGSFTGTPTPTFSWLFGDNTPATPHSSNSNASHQYSAPGRYRVFLEVRNSEGTNNCFKDQIVTNAPTLNKPTSSTSIIYTGSRVINVNPDNNTVTAINTSSNTKLWEASVGKNPQTLAEAPNGEIWVANQDDATISVLNQSTGGTVKTISLPYASRPYGVVFAPNGQSAFVSLQGTGRVLKMSLTGSIMSNLLVGPDPRGLAVRHDSNRLYVTRFKSKGNTGSVWELDTNPFVILKTIALGFDPGPDSPTSSRGVPNYVNDIQISPDGSKAMVSSKKDNIAAGQFRDGSNLTFETQVRTIVSHIDMVSRSEILGARLDIDNNNMAQFVRFSPLGDLMVIGMLGSNRINFFDAANPTSLAQIDTLLAPRGMVFNTDGSRLYVHNFLSRSVSVYDTDAITKAVGVQVPLIQNISTVANESLTATVLKGKQIFYNARDPRMTREEYLSCATCHLDGGSDGQIWDFTQGGEGLRNTISLRGRGGTDHGNVHWTANFDEIHDFENDIRNNFGGIGFLSDPDFAATQNPLGNPKAGLSADLDALVSYVESLKTTPNSPHRNSDGTLSPDGLAGKDIFFAQNCQACHVPPLFTDKNRHDVGTIQPSSGQGIGQSLAGIGFETPTLLGVWNNAPYFHNGQSDTLMDVINKTEHADNSNLTQTEKDQLVAYINQIDDIEKSLFNGKPTADAGPDQTGARAVGFPMETKFEGSGSDDGLPSNPGTLTYTWDQIVGPDNAVIVDRHKKDSLVRFPRGGLYTFRLTVDDGADIDVDDVNIQVNGAPAQTKGILKFHPVINPSKGLNQMDISYKLATEGHVIIRIINRQGRVVRTLFDGIQSQDTYIMPWDGLDDNGKKVPSDSYTLLIHMAGETIKKKLAVIK